MAYKIAIALILAVPLATLAQTGPVSSDIQLSLSPKYPGPEETVLITASSNSFNVNANELVWHVGGRVVERGIAKTQITITTGHVGQPTNITVTANPASRQVPYERALTVWPSVVDLLWQTNTYTLPTYRGKALPVRGSTATIIALPSIAASSGYYKHEDLLYEWRVNNKLYIPQSGRGKSTFTLPLTYSKNIPQIVSVTVENSEKTAAQEQKTTIMLRDPEIHFYEMHPLRGPRFETSLSSYALASGSEVEVLAVPYFASAPAPILSFGWKVSNQLLPAENDRADVLLFRTEAGAAGQQTISLEISNPLTIIEQFRKSLRIHVN